MAGPTPQHEQLLAEPERVREGVIVEARRHGADAVWIESVVTDTVSTADLQCLVYRPDIVGRLSRILDDLAEGPGAELLGDYPDRLRHRIPAMDLPAEHPLRDGGTALLKRARELVLANLLGEV